MARRSQFTHRTIGDDGISEIQLPLQSSGISPSPMSPIQQQLKQERLKNSKATRTLRIIYASVAVGFAIASIIFWMRFIQFYYDPTKHSDAFFATLTTACTINIRAAIISIIKGLFPSKKDN